MNVWRGILSHKHDPQRQGWALAPISYERYLMHAGLRAFISNFLPCPSLPL